MKISITDKGSGISKEFARAIGAHVEGRFIRIPESKGSGYLTGFSWGTDLRMMIRNYHLKEDVLIERTNELAEGQEDIIFLLSGVLRPPLNPSEPLVPEQANLMICRHAVSSIIAMPRDTIFGSITIAASKQHLQHLFGQTDHPVITGILNATANFVLESSVSPEIINTATDLITSTIPEVLESQYYKLKCEELLYHTIALLMKRETLSASAMYISDVKAIYAIKTQLLNHLNEPPNIAAFASQARLSAPKLRKIFKQTFGQGIFAYYQTARMQKAAQLLKNEHLSVTEVGYQLGFTNLSHFARVFRAHTGIKPKKYSAI
jgi:AraC-like DNA-binding protein